MLRVKLKHLDKDVELRKNVARYYIEHVVNPLIITPIVTDWQSHVFHLFPIRCKRRDELQLFLEMNNIQTNIHYPIPPHKQACFKEWNNWSFPITEQIHYEELSLPMSPFITDNELNYIVNKLNSFV